MGRAFTNCDECNATQRCMLMLHVVVLAAVILIAEKLAGDK